MQAPRAAEDGRSSVVLEGIPCYAPEHAGRGFAASDAAALSAAVDTHFWLRYRTRLIVWALDRYARDARRGLDLGCGAGAMIGTLRRARPGLVLDGADISLAAFKVAARALPGARLMQIDAADAPFVATYDVVGLFDVLEHIDDDVAVLAGARWMLAPGGHLILTVPRHPFLWSHLDTQVHHRRRYRAAELKAKVRAAGFEVRAVIGYGALLLPLAYLARFAYRNARGLDPVLRLPPLLNTVLNGIERLERALIRAGVRFPFGDSFMVVAVNPEGSIARSN